MAKLYFRYGAMGSSKTMNILMVRYNYMERGKKVVLLKPKRENRDGENIVKSRIGPQAECEFADEFLANFFKNPIMYDCILVDEAQFISKEEVESLARIVDEYDIPVICYGLKTDFQTHLFEGSKRLLELANVIEEVPTICWCGKKAMMNARVKDGQIVYEGEQFMLGGNDSYVSLCRKHYYEGKIRRTDNK